MHFDLSLILILIGIILFTGLVSGSYPALYLSKFNPLAILKGKLNSSFSELLARKGLVVFQFTLSVMLIVAVLVVYRQIQFIQSTRIGYNKDNVIRFDSEGPNQRFLTMTTANSPMRWQSPQCGSGVPAADRPEHGGTPSMMKARPPSSAERIGLIWFDSLGFCRIRPFPPQSPAAPLFNPQSAIRNPQSRHPAGQPN